VDRKAHWVEVELKEDAGCATVVVKHAGVVGDTVLMGVQWGGARRYVCRRYDVQKVLVRDEGWKYALRSGKDGCGEDDLRS
jgi:hypothetical protein